jgi:hypothetical protein
MLLMSGVKKVAAFWKSLSAIDRFYLLGIVVFGSALVFDVYGMFAPSPPAAPIDCSKIFGTSDIYPSTHGGDLYVPQQ